MLELTLFQKRYKKIMVGLLEPEMKTGKPDLQKTVDAVVSAIALEFGMTKEQVTRILIWEYCVLEHRVQKLMGNKK